jgi:hypothetical protein
MPLFFSFVIVVYCLVRFVVILHSLAIAVTSATLQALTVCEEVFAFHSVECAKYSTQIFFKFCVVGDVNIAIKRLVNEPTYD